MTTAESSTSFKRLLRAWLCASLGIVLLLAAGCQTMDGVAPIVDINPTAREPEQVRATLSPTKSTPVSMRGYNYTAEGVQEFYVDGDRVSNLPPYGGGGKDSCCAKLSDKWHAGMTVRVDWTIGHYTVPYERRKQFTFDEQGRFWSERTLHLDVPVQPYDEPETLQVFFLPDDKLEVWAYPAGPQNPEHPSKRGYPVDPHPSTPASELP
jgi:hypothetical protein